MQSGFHNLPTVNGVGQKNGREFRARDIAYAAGGRRAVFSLDIAGAYPPEAKLRSWARTVTLNRGRDVVVSERYELVEAREPVRLSLMSWRVPTVAGEGRLRLEDPEGAAAGKAVLVEYDAKKFKAEVETVPVEDERLQASWGTRLYRILLTARQTPLRDAFEVRIALPTRK
jgi:hypothetical protein